MARHLAFLRFRQIPYLVVGEQRVDLLRALQRLSETLRVDTIVSDAGGVLNGALLRAGLVDEVDLVILPAVIGVADTPAIFAGYSPGAPMLLKTIHTETRPDGSILLRMIPEPSRSTHAMARGS